VPVGTKTWFHAMKTTEVYFILKGKGEMFIDDEMKEVEKFDTIYIPSNAKQCIENIGEEELEFLCIVDPAWTQEDEVLLK
jgi:mannose-6-phosphate isomerase-like protein (cupin superfamily)